MFSVVKNVWFGMSLSLKQKGVQQVHESQVVHIVSDVPINVF